MMFPLLQQGVTAQAQMPAYQGSGTT